MAVKTNSILSYTVMINDIILIGNDFSSNTMSSGSNFLDFKNIKKISMKDNKFSNIEYEEEGVSSNLINLRKEVL